jgi:hypothetical protein
VGTRRDLGFMPPLGIVAAVVHRVVSVRALTGVSRRTALQRPQNLASAALSNPHLHCIVGHLSVPHYQAATTIIFVSHALKMRMMGTAGAAPASEMQSMREQPRTR